MNGERFMQALGDIDGKYVAEFSEVQKTEKRRLSKSLKIIVIAACLCVLAVTVFFAAQYNAPDPNIDYTPVGSGDESDGELRSEESAPDESAHSAEVSVPNIGDYSFGLDESSDIAPSEDAESDGLLEGFDASTGGYSATSDDTDPSEVLSEAPSEDPSEYSSEDLSEDDRIDMEDAPRAFIFTSFGDLKELKSALSDTDEELLAHMQAKSYYAYGVTTREVAQSIITLFERLETVYIDEASGYKAEWIRFTPEKSELYIQYFNSARHRIEVYAFIDMQNPFSSFAGDSVYGRLNISGVNVDLKTNNVSEFLIGTLTARNASVALRIQKNGSNISASIADMSNNGYATVTSFKNFFKQ